LTEHPTAEQVAREIVRRENETPAPTPAEINAAVALERGRVQNERRQGTADAVIAHENEAQAEALAKRTIGG
jgi:hypothetical protein